VLPGYEQLARRLEQAEAELSELRQRIPATPAAFQSTDPSSPAEEQGLSERGYAVIQQRLGDVEAFLKKNASSEFPLFRVSGFAQLDTGMFSKSEASRAEYGNIQNGTGFRRARLNVNGNVTEQTKYWFEVDFAAAGRPSFMDVWGEQSDIPYFGTIRIGQYRQPITLDAAVNVRHLEFMEYST